MNFKFPDRITIQLIGKDHRALPLENILILLKVKAGTKNPYRIQLPLTSKSGKTEVARAEVQEQIEAANASFAMDYNGDIEKCAPDVEISLFDGAQYRKHLGAIKHFPLSQYEKKHWKTRQEVIEYVLKNKNSGFTTTKTVDLSLLGSVANIDLIIT